jgi:hypothetical protein
MKRNFILSILVLLLVAVAAGCAPKSESNTQPRVLAVSGTGKVTLAPDVAYINIGVQSRADTVAEALNQNSIQAQAVVKALTDLGVDPKDIQTSSFNIFPQQEMDEKGMPSRTIYMVDNTVYVKVKDLPKLGQMLDSVVKSGANSIHGITFDVQDKTAANSEARKLAVEDAYRQAQELAKAANVTLGDVQTLNASSSYRPVPMYQGDAVGKLGGGGEVPVAAGQILLTVDVSITYQIK